MKEKVILEDIQGYAEDINQADISLSVMIARKVVSILDSLGNKVIKTSLYDDTWLEIARRNFSVAPEDAFRSYEFQKGHRENRFDSILKSIGWSENYYKESDFVSAAENLLEIIMKNMPDEWSITNNGRGNYLKLNGSTKRIKIRGKRSNISDVGENYPSCQVLDAAIYLDKLTKNDIAITVLNIKYLQQQADTKEILNLYGITEIPVLVVYYDETGVVMKIDTWGSQTNEIAKLLRRNFLAIES